MADFPIIRPMLEQDIYQVLAIERASFEDPWEEEDFLGDLHTNTCARYLVMECDGNIVGYAGMWLIIGEAYIINIAVSPQHRHRGYGRMLMISVLRLAYELLEITYITLDVRASNITAQALYRSMGFKVVERKPGYYPNGEAAYTMALEDSTPYLKGEVL